MQDADTLPARRAGYHFAPSVFNVFLASGLIDGSEYTKQSILLHAPLHAARSSGEVCV